MTISALHIQESLIKECLDQINDEFYQSLHQTKSDLVRKAAKRLEEDIGVPKEMVCRLIIKHLRFIDKDKDKDRRLVYRALGQEYKRDYEKTESDILSQVDDNNAIEEDSRKVREHYGIKEEDEPMISDPEEQNKFYKMKEKMNSLATKCKSYEDQFYHFKALFEEGLRSGAVKNEMCHEIAIHPDEYDHVLSIIKKSPNGVLVIHDGYNAIKFKSMKFKRPVLTEGIEN
jgi:uncharacterized protein YdiU (UPF0061 family)